MLHGNKAPIATPPTPADDAVTANECQVDHRREQSDFGADPGPLSDTATHGDSRRGTDRRTRRC
jgi:hypothetical protein